VYNIKEHLASLADLGKAFKALRELEKQVEQDRVEGSRVKGGNEIGEYEL